MSWLAVQLACVLLKWPLSIPQRTKLLSAILASNNAVPLKDVISFNEIGTLCIDGKPVDLEKATHLRESARLLRENAVYKLIREQIASLAGRRGISEGDTPEKLYFYRAALWFGGQEQEYIDALAQDE